jgi:hypothetical protein
MQDLDKYKISEDQELLELATYDENRLVATCMTRQSIRFLDIISRQLDPSILNTPEFIEAVREMIIKKRRPRIRIIVFEPDTIVRHGHHLLDLAARHSSFIELRKASNEFHGYNEFLLVADETAYLHRNNASRYEATANFNDRRQSKFYLDNFEIMWNLGSPDQNLRPLKL